MKAKYRKQRQRFEQEATAVLLEVGAAPIKTKNPWPCFLLETEAGALDISLHTSLWYVDDPCFLGGDPAPWVATRFRDVERANKAPGISGELNQYSGKWNHHYWANWTDSFFRGLEELRVRLINVLPDQPR